MYKLLYVVFVASWASVWSVVQYPILPQQPFIVYPLNAGPSFNNQTDGYGYDARGCKSNIVNSTGSHHFFVGCVNRTSKLIFVQQYQKPSRWYQAREKIVDYPGTQQPGFVPASTIVGIRIYDNYFNGSGGHASIISGGVGSKHVRLRLRSKSAGHGFNFLVKIYGN